MVGLMKRTILIAGSGSNQVGIIRRAVELGFRVVAVDGFPDAPGFECVADSEVGDIRDATVVSGIAQRYNADGIYPATEVAVESVATACLMLGLPGLHPDVARRLCNKEAMREALYAAGLPGPQYAVVDSHDKARAAATQIGYPLIAKPFDAQASKGVSYCHDETGLDSAFRTAMTCTTSGAVLIEAFMEGPEFCVDGLVYEGVYYPAAITGKEVSPLPHRFDLGIFTPAPLSDQETQSIEQCVASAVKALGVGTATIHAEVILTKEGPRIVEIAGRPGGGRIPTDLIPLSYGSDYVADSLGIALGDSPKATRTHNQGAALFWFQAKAGEVTAVNGVEQALTLPGVVELVLRVSPKDTLAPIVDCATRDRIGYVLTQGDDTQAAVAVAKEVLSLVNIQTKDPSS